MAIEQLDLELCPPRLPPEVSRLIQAAERQWDQWFARQRSPYPSFLPSDSAVTFAALDYVTRHDIAPGRIFCEWGSGLGTATCLAALLGYEAYGLEIEPELVARSRQMARELAIAVKILCTSYLPEGYEVHSGVGGEALVHPPPGCSPGVGIDHERRYEGMEIAIATIDLFFVYPWPDEHGLIQTLFDAVAGAGAILIAYYSNREIGVYRKLHDAGGRFDEAGGVAKPSRTRLTTGRIESE